MEIIDFRFLGHQAPLMTPGGLDPSDTYTITSTNLLTYVVYMYIVSDMFQKSYQKLLKLESENSRSKLF